MEFLFEQPMFPTKSFDILPLGGVHARRVRKTNRIQGVQRRQIHERCVEAPRTRVGRGAVNAHAAYFISELRTEYFFQGSSRFQNRGTKPRFKRTVSKP